MGYFLYYWNQNFSPFTTNSSLIIIIVINISSIIQILTFTQIYSQIFQYRLPTQKCKKQLSDWENSLLFCNLKKIIINSIYFKEMGVCTSGKQSESASYKRELKHKNMNYTSTILVTKQERYVFETEILSIAAKNYGNKPIEISIVFRASEQSYQAEKFHNSTDGVADTFLLAKTNQNRIFGAFTPCTWHKDTMYKYEADEKGLSFLFALLNKTPYKQDSQFKDSGMGSQKSPQIKKQVKYSSKIYKILQKQKAIMNHLDKGPIFGQGHDIMISDRCNENVSWCNLGKSYSCSHSFGSKKANNQLAGNSKFLIHDYEIWSVKFNN